MSLVAFADNEAAGEADQTVTEQAAVETPFDQTVTVDGVDITVKAAEGVFPAGAELSAKSVDVPDAIDSNNALAFDIKILADGEEVQPKDNAKVEVSFKAAEVKKNETEVYHMDGNKADKLDVETKGTTATVETTGFSTYVLVFTVVGGKEDNYNYTIGEDQKAPLSTIISGAKYDPRKDWYHETTDHHQKCNNSEVTYNYNEAKSSDKSKLLVANTDSGDGSYYAYVPAGAKFNDGESLTLTIPWSYTYTCPSHSSYTYPVTGEVTININIASVEGNIVPPEAIEGLVYNGQQQTLVTEATCTGLTGISFEYKVDNGTWQKWGTAEPKATDAGEHTVYWRAMGSNGAVDSGEVPVTIADIEVTAPVAEDYLEYNKADQTLLAEPASTTATGVTIEYAVTAVNADAPETGWVSEYKNAKKQAAGDYWVWYRVVTNEETPSVLVKPAHVDASIDKAACPVEVESKEVLTYTGAAQVLVRELNNQGGQFTVNYSVDDAEWVTGVAKATGTEVGYYEVRWKVDETDNYYGAGGSVDAYIVEENKMFADVTYTAKQDTSDPDGVWVYDGKKHGVTVAAKVMTEQETSTVVQNATVYYALENLTASNYRQKGTTSPTSIYPKNAGDYTIYYYIVADDYEPVAGSADVQINKAYLRITVLPQETEYGTPVDYEDVDELRQAEEEGYIRIEAFKDSSEKASTPAWPYIESSISGRNQFEFDTNGYTGQQSDAKLYTVKVKRGVLDSDNYIIKYTDGVLNVYKKMIRFIWSEPHEWTYDGQPHRVDARINTRDLVGDDKKEDITFEYTSDQVEFTNEATDVRRIDIHDTEDPSKDTDWGVGDYTAQIEELGGNRGYNYTIYKVVVYPTTKKHVETNERVDTATKTFRINPVAITVTPNPVSAIYGEMPVWKGYTAATLVNGEKQEDVISGKFDYVFMNSTKDTEYEPGQPVADTYYSKFVTDEFKFNTKTGLHATNYELTPNNGEMTLTKRPATIYLNSNTIAYGSNPAYKGYYIDNKKVFGNDKLADSITPTSSYKKNGKPGQYAIGANVKGLNPNYYIAGVKQGTLTVVDRVGTLMAKGTKSGKKGILISWNSVSGAASYDVYMSLCNTKKKAYTPVYVGSTYGNSLKVTKIGKKKLKAKKAYKYYVVAKNASGAVIAQSQLGHFITNNVKGKKVNAKSMAVNTHSVTIAKGGTAGLSASYTKAKKGKKYKLLDAWHSPLTRYVSENPAVATVDANGVVYGVGSGWTRVYVIGVSGMWETVEVNVN
jgi:hypothetical protein